MKKRNFDQAILDAPVRQEYLDDLSDIQYALYIAGCMTIHEWMRAVFEVSLVAIIALAVYGMS